MDKRNTRKEKIRRNKGYPYKSKIPSNVNQTEKYIILNEKGKEIARYRLKQTCYQEHGIKCKIRDISKI